jgi:threonine aldolase
MTTTVETAASDTMSRLHDASVRGFASDNYSGVHPEVLAALAAANEGHQVSYGEDAYTARLQELMEEHFGPGIECFPVFNGTGANVLSLQSLLPRWGAVVCASTAHINMDENGAPERVGGMKLLQVDTPDGKLTPELIDREAWGWGDEHRAQPLAVSITQTTELGTCYTADEVRAIAEHVHAKGMKLHMDGARLANAAAHLGVPLRAFTRDAGVDILSFGGTKNGLLFGEVVVALNPEAAQGLLFLRKMNMQLASKMRFMSAQFIALLEGDLWLRSASHANAMARRLRDALDAGIASGDLPGLGFTQETQSNGVFATLPAGVADRLRDRGFKFYDWDASRNEVRWMCSFDTSESDIDDFVAGIRDELHAAA